MPLEIVVPQMGESIVEATVAQWLKKPGEAVKAREALVELETDKVNQVIEADADGVLTQILAEVGATVAVGQAIGVLEAGATAAPAPTSGGASAVASPAPPSAGADATPVAAAMAAANNVPLDGVAGTGPAGKIGKADVEAKIATPKAVAPPVAAPAPAPPSDGGGGGRPIERIPMARKRKTIAANLKHAQNTAAILTTFNEVDMSKVMELRARRKTDFEGRFGVGLGFMSFFTKATIGALKQFPMVNAEIDDARGEIILKKYYDIGIAVGLEDGLVVPIIRDADKLSFAAIEKKIKELAGKAKEGKLGLSDLTGGSFSITNGGTFGSMLSTPILNYPQVGILGMHNIVKRPVVVGDEIVIRPIMYLALSYDHRIIDGSTAVRFLVKIKELIEDPETLLLEG
ncbi:2-oxoglutarate dehydrogenase complex dihydrolipoyllysine-residue succinyltransferase [Armatimonas rosea]|uniref:Dihydrolipoyllysine-residue succinyltransferase component of 2-oxoglutarate dehydrogenase complex n=1 Tax=Armatimonas rosea TaxID=685828 RepID=A0A7W9SSE5_ARMRO|nr:2-oxoglutarate dehydrogenase complex dihydrolipoyllysine-residue succinyltransferase [Armatimonas rosea]MBB6051309.1 2-oxoglutarate dehydrogenase E2 component (dihydrolipoamide succinyltransferase) [Armatimonas rosea]